jgi:hypothetical protein
MAMNKREFAALLNGRNYGNEMTRSEERMAKENGLVALFGYSDDCAEFRGAIDAEIGCYDGGIIWLDDDGIFEPPCSDDTCKLRKKHMALCKVIEVFWCNGEGEPSWTYDTEIPYETFDIYDDGELYCRGIVFDFSALADKDGEGEKK